MDGEGENVGVDLTRLVPVEEVVAVNPVVDQKKHEPARSDDWKMMVAPKINDIRERLFPNPNSERLFPNPNSERLFPNPNSERLFPNPNSDAAFARTDSTSALLRQMLILAR